ncbi:PCI domain-containing protein [Haematococcus lacustris]|uniref:PCI domain-containing protein n=1 Tax=Haematococcus lacustris TaxID=44745 RepID=A0A699ZIR5_HAELA|nr:PCI domain-containing protein [Haematococcus lacustris]
MVDEGSIAASISDTDGGMVHFLADKDQCRTAEMTRKLQRCMAQCMELSERVTAAHEAMATDREYLRKVTGKERLLRYDTAAEEAAGLGSSGMFHAP